MEESKLCPVCEYEILDDARFLCPHCNFELKCLEDNGEIERAKQVFTEKYNDHKESPLQENDAIIFFSHLFFGFLGGSLPWIVPGIYEIFEYGERSLKWILWPYTSCGIQIGLVTGFLVGFFIFWLEKKNRKPHDRQYIFLFSTFIISLLISSPILSVYWLLDAF